MKPKIDGLCWALLFFLAFALVMQAQPTPAASSSVPRLIRYSGIATDAQGARSSGTVGATFALYKDQQGGAALWVETQNVNVDSSGRYTVELGATKPDGLPAELFTSGEARWLGVTINGQVEQPRVLLLSVPYALKAADAETIGGLPPSAFVLAPPPNSDSSTPSSSASNDNSNAPPVGGTGTTDYLPIWTNSTTLGSSVLFQSGTGAKAKVGINTTKPASTLDVKGGGTIRGLLSLPATGTAGAGAGFKSQPLDLAASAFNSGSSTAVTQTFQWQAEPVGNNTSNAAGSLNLLFGQGTTKPSETGLNIASNGQITFASGQTFPGAGTITGVTAGTDLSGGGTSGNVTLNLDTGKVPQLAGGNAFTGNQTVNGNVSATQLISTVATGTNPLQVASTTQVPNLNASFLDGLSASAFQLAGSYATLGANTFGGTQSVGSGDISVSSGNLDLPQTAASGSAGVINLGGVPFIHACCGTTATNTFVGGAGNFAITGTDNTAQGFEALVSDTTGWLNTATGYQALYSNTTGNDNTANGAFSLLYNTTGSDNTSLGYTAGRPTNNQATTGSSNTFVGSTANPGTQTNLNNATAIGANAQVTASNAMVLGSIAGVNGASSGVNVGIGTTAPASTLDVHGTGNFTGLITFASGQTFPGTGTITGVTAGTDLAGGGTGGTVTLNLDTGATDARYAQLKTANSFTGNQNVTGNISASGTVAGGIVNAAASFDLGGTPFAFGSTSNANVFVGFAGNSTTSGASNTATGDGALAANTAGGDNTAVGAFALGFNKVGGNNTAFGYEALQLSTTGFNNTAIGDVAGVPADASNVTGSNDTFLGANSLSGTGSLNNATAVGANAEVDASNALVLGSINGVNNATANTNVGIGTTTPGTTLDIVSNSTYQPLFVESSSGFGTWMELNNTSSGGRNWAILSAGGANAEGAGNLGITNFTGTSTIYLEGNVSVTGNLSKGGGSFKIDHPLDPANKYLYHSFVESPDMMNVYNGNITTNQRGLATVALPEYFEALNRDFRYQLTVIGQFAQAIVAKEISRNRFTIRTSKPGVKVSWQVTGIRHDAYANAHRIRVEEEKPPQEQGRYLHPELFGATQQKAEQDIGAVTAQASIARQ